MDKIRITSSISIDSDELHEKFVQSSGPGGQNVNKVATAVQLRFDIRNSPNLPERVKAKLFASGDSRITKEGEILITADSKRTQQANRRDALQRLIKALRDASFMNKPRVATKPTRGSIKKRLDSKTKRGELKKNRSGKIDFS